MPGSKVTVLGGKVIVCGNEVIVHGSEVMVHGNWWELQQRANPFLELSIFLNLYFLIVSEYPRLAPSSGVVPASAQLW